MATVLPNIEKNKIPVQEVNTSYLQGSHFTLSQEESWTPWTRLSTFKKDYIPYNVNDKPPAAKPKQPANIFNRDERYFNNNHSASETLAEYQRKPLSEKATYDTDKLRKTNFKMDSDLRQKEPYLSIQKTSYPPKSGDYSKAQPTLNTTTSHIPQGDKEKAPQPLSDYRDRFRGESNARIFPVKAAIGDPTIKGDQRIHGYDTTHQENYKGAYIPPPAAVEAHRGSSIPLGDQEKECRHQTEFQMAYKGHSGVKGYDPSSLKTMQKTQFRLDDGHNFYNDYGTTMKAAYVPKEATVERSTMGERRNHSEIPPGDIDPWRQSERGVTTTYGYDLRAPPGDYRKGPTVDGASIRTRSQVPFGDEAQNKDFYKTTNNDVYVPQNGRPASNSGNQGASSLPLDYYPESMRGTTTQKIDYQDPHSGRTGLNDETLHRIKKTSIRAPLGGERFFSTTHRDHFTPVDLGEGLKVDTNKLQKSSVPMGTLYK